MKNFVLTCLSGVVVSTTSLAAPSVSPASRLPAGAVNVEPRVAGRMTQSGRYQWPGLYFEATFKGRVVYFETGAGDVILHVSVDGAPAGSLVKPRAGWWRVDGLAKGEHALRVDAVTESQNAPNAFVRFALPAGFGARSTTPRVRQIEFIGDSHTVGYGNTSTTRDCTGDEVWKTTDTSLAFGPKVARHYDADYQVNAISGRGIVRNYGGSAGDPLPVAYPFTLLDHGARYEDATWRPQIIVIALGTNDFSTPLHAGEKWASRDALRADYEATYATFLDDLRARNPRAYFVIWATDLAEGEIASEASRVVEQRKAHGDAQLEFLRVDGLAMTGCHWHPSVADDDAIAARLIARIDALGIWKPRS